MKRPSVSKRVGSGGETVVEFLFPDGKGGLISFRDELRPKVQETIQGFKETGVALKVISGDNPNTVAALARQAGLGDDIQLVSGTDLAELDLGRMEYGVLLVAADRVLGGHHLEKVQRVERPSMRRRHGAQFRFGFRERDVQPALTEACAASRNPRCGVLCTLLRAGDSVLIRRYSRARR